MQYLKQSTAVDVMLGVFIDDTDGKTPEEALTLAQADLQLSKNCGAAAQKTEATSATHIYGGNYKVPLDATDTGTLGRLDLMCKEAGALPVKANFMVITANAYDSMCSTDKLEVDIAQIGGVAQSMTDLKDLVDTGYDPATHKIQGVVLSDTITTYTGNTKQTANNNVILAHADYGLAKLVRSTTPANKLDVNATGEAGLDFANIKNATGAHTLTNITIPVCTTNTDMVGTDNANTVVPDAAGVAATPAEVATALMNINLDHLCKTATAGADMTTEVVDNSILSRILSNGDTSAFVPSTDGLQLIRDRGDSAWTTGAGGSDRLLMVDTTIATLASQTSFTLTAGSTDDNAYNNCTIIIEDASTAAQKAVGIISDYTGATKTITLKYDPAIFAMTTTDKVYILAENALKSTLANRQLNVAADGDIAGNIDGNVASCTTNTDMRGTDSAALASVLGAAVGASISADIAAVKTQTVAIEADTDVIDDGTSGLVKIASDVAAVLVDTSATLENRLIAIETDTDVIDDATSGLVKIASDVAAALADTNELQTDDYPTSIAAIKTETALIVADTNELQTDNIPGTLATIAGYLDTEIAAILADTNELQADWVNGGRLDLLVDAIKAQTDLVTTARMGALTDWINGGRLDLVLDIIAADTTTDIPALIAALNNLSAANVNAEVVDVLKTDTKGEPAQGAPGATLSIEDKIAYIYKFLRNQVWTTETEINVYNNAADTVDHKSTISDDGVTFKREKFSSGP